MGIPFQIPAKGMQDKDKTGCKKFRFIIFVKHTEDDASDSRKKMVEERAVLQEIRTQLFRNSKDEMPVFYMNDFKRHGGGTVNGVFIATGGTKAAFAAERNKL